jgi:glycosyltransferase involved in cell wall biosynthesis
MRGLKYVSWGDTTGYAVAAKAYVRALAAQGVPLTWAPMLAGRNLYEPHGSRDWPCPTLAAVCNRPIDYDTVLIHTVPEYYPGWIERERRAGRRILGYTVWELEHLPPHWPAILNQLDGLLLPCHWNVQVFRDSGVTVPLHVVPHLSQFEGLDATRPDDALDGRWRERLQAAGAGPDALVFYAIGFWSNRKAMDRVLEAFVQAFDARDPVALVLKTSRNDITRWHRHWRNGFRLRHPSPAATVAQRLRAHPNPPPGVVVTDEGLSEAEMLALHRCGDCLVSLARTEGWGLGLFEAARLGKPVIASAYGGQMDYLSAQESCIVPHRMVPVHEPTWAMSYRPSDRWAEPSVEQASRWMRAVFESPAGVRQRAARQGERIRRDFSSEVVTRRLVQALEASQP